jgi:outer membrane protein OmpU
MMKKILLGSTALAVGGLMAAPAMAADPIKMGVGGYYQFYALAGSIESNYALSGNSIQYKGVQFIQEGEIHFIGQSKMDNGTTIGVRVELEGWNPATNTNNAAGPTVGSSARTIDEAYLFAFGDWGRVEFGAKDDAPYVMYYGTPSALLGFGFVQHNTSFSWTNPVANGANKAAFHISAMTLDAQYQDVNRINYYTPRFFGLQVGVGYAPKINLTTAGLNTGPGANTGAVCGFNDATTANGCPTNDYSWQDALSIGANYLNKFGDVAVAAYVGYSYMNFVPGLQPLASAANLVTGGNLSSWKQFAAGLQFSVAGFTLGGSYIWDNNGLGTNYYTGVDNDTRAYSVGVMYETGPWQMSVGGTISYNNNGNGSLSLVNTISGTSVAVAGAPGSQTAAFGTNQNAGALAFGTETASKIEVGANYAIGPGVKLTGGAIFNTLSGPSNLVAGQSWAALLGMDFRF